MHEQLLAERVTDLERSTLTHELLGWLTAAAVILLIITLRRKGILTTDLFHEAFPDA